MASLVEKMQKAIIEGELDEATSMVQQALKEMAPTDIITKVVTPAMNKVGELYSSGEYYVPDMLLSARAAKGMLNLVRPLLASGDLKPVATIVVGTVQGDLHDIGKNLVAMMMEGAGFQVVDLGIDVSPEQFAKAAKENNAEMIGLSALLSTTMPQMATTIEALDQANIRSKTKVLIGGAPVTEAYAKSIGADGYAADAASAVTVAKRILSA